MTSTKIWCESVLLADGWARNVRIEITDTGEFGAIDKGITDPALRRECEVIPGTMLPGVPNCHSHAHQRAMAGLGEQLGQFSGSNRGAEVKDSFWTWRKVMYHYLARIEPDDLNAISEMLYLEMLKSGYTCVGEFQYLHHDTCGKPYSDIAEMTIQCLEASSAVGIGFTALPVLYRYGGFGGQDPLESQARFLNDEEAFCRIVSALNHRASGDDNMAVGIAPHSLRAVTGDLLQGVIDALPKPEVAAIHLHIAEQTMEVDDCVNWSGRRPMEWLFDHFDVDSNWCLIHATHMTQDETVALARSGAVAGLCPTTEANLGDGFFNIPDYLQSGGRWAIGSDSHISISPVEELRWLEYGQRLLSRQRNVMAGVGVPNTGMGLFQAAVRGGAQACGRRIGEIARGYRADFLVLDSDHPRLCGRHENDLVDSWVFSGNENTVKDVYVGGQQVITMGRHHNEEQILRRYQNTLQRLAG